MTSESIDGNHGSLATDRQFGQAVVIGLGHRDRADDGIGPAVAEAIRERTDEVTVIIHEGDLTVLPLLWEGHDDVVIVDACRGAAPIGVLHEIDPDDLTAGAVMSTHGLSVADALALARRLSRLPVRLRLFGIPGQDFGYGPMSPELNRSVPSLVDQLLAELGVSADA